ncbi:uncharacterized protein LOC661835 [Tribolium castaneum]|uniref:Uncharacterized protein n=1 Tax=Tribolium castaneum TaxID=7070 RepID=D2A1X3_TRICA|nr:PREDICTED: uncharacterized protein LOC661835 isoform X1 [Tribolium castaneum]EFA02070.2 hypothetical protein TcasGA2_TC007704 [Tribolium castaneum]|eukprot:XP_008191612.1 PREDICTED: uncharacterized protein LOC661835 isoform X1 [Tribolium castaneum]
MRDNFNMLPIVQDNMNYIPRSLTNLSSNGYYGYQPPLLEKMKEEKPCFMEVQQFENPSSKNRKRAWDFGTTTDLLEFKKRRQNECSPFVYQQQSTNRTDANLRKPTHNIPDMPRCIMGHFI